MVNEANVQGITSVGHELSYGSLPSIKPKFENELKDLFLIL